MDHAVASVAPQRKRIPHDNLLLSTFALLPLFAIVLLLGDGFMGGGGDDGTYLSIAQHWIEHGASIPANHWEGRWPLLLPLALSIKLFGLRRWSVALPSFLAACTSLILIRRLGDEHFGKPVGIAAAAIMAILPNFTRQATTAAVEPLELMFVLASAALLRWPVLAGIAFGMAFQVRETSIAALPVLLILSGSWRCAVRLLAGFSATLAVEGAAFYLLAGDPLFRRILSLHHTALHTHALSIRTQHPLFNLDVIRNWHSDLGFHLHWTVDGYLNLIPNPIVNLLPAFAILLFIRDHRDRRVKFFLLAALFYSAVLIYGLAILPTPRMFQPALAALALAFAAMCVARWDALAKASVATMAVISLACALTHPSSKYWQDVAEGWAAQYPVETTQQRYWVFSPTLQSLPRTGRPYLLGMEGARCARARPLPVIREASGGRFALAIGYRWYLCLYRVPTGRA